MYPVILDVKLSCDAEKGQLLAIFESCHAEELAAADRLSHPAHSMLYLRLRDALTTLRHKGDEIGFAQGRVARRRETKRTSLRGTEVLRFLHLLLA